MITALRLRLGLGLRLDFGSQVWFVQYLLENLVVVLYAKVGHTSWDLGHPPCIFGFGVL